MSEIIASTIPGDKKLEDVAPQKIVDMIPSIPMKAWALDDYSYSKIYKPDSVARQLRYGFWAEYNRAKNTNKKMNESHIYAGVCSQTTYLKAVKKTNSLGWILRPPKEYQRAMEELLDMGLDRLHEILMMPIPRDMRYAASVTKNILSAYMIIDQRVKGSVAIKHEVLQKNLNLNIDGNQRGVVALHDLMTAQQLDQKIRELEKKLAIKPADHSIGAIDIPHQAVEDTIVRQTDED